MIHLLVLQLLGCVVEFAPRASGEATLVPIEETPSYIAEIIQSGK